MSSSSKKDAEDENDEEKPVNINDDEDEKDKEKPVNLNDTEDEKDTKKQVTINDAEDEKDTKKQINLNDAEDEKDTKENSNINDADYEKDIKKQVTIEDEKEKRRESERSVLELQEAESEYSFLTLQQELHEFRTRESTLSSVTQASYPGIYHREYDYIAERNNPFATNLLGATSYLIKGCLGVGILSMHEGFMYGGMVSSGVGAAAIGYLLGHCMNILVRSAQRMYLVIHVPRLTYPDLAEAAVATGPLKKLRQYSKKVRYIVEILLFLETSGCCSLYEIVIAKTIKKVLEFLSAPIKEMQIPVRAYLFLMMIPLMILCVIRKWKYLAPLSIVADLFVAVCVITTMVYSMSGAEGIHKRSLFKSVPGLFKFFGICLYTMDGTRVILPIENNMRSPHHADFVIYTGMTIVFLLSALAGFLGYWGWGEECSSPVTIHMPLETIPIILQFLLAVMLAVTLAIQFWVPFKIIWHYLGKRRNAAVERRYSLEKIYRMLLLFFITCVSSVFPQPKNLMIFIGVTFTCINTLVFPTLIETSVFWHDHIPGKIRWSLVKIALICILSITFSFGGLYSLFFT